MIKSIRVSQADGWDCGAQDNTAQAIPYLTLAKLRSRRTPHMPDRMKRIKTVEHDQGGGWIARNPWTGQEILETGWRWNSRSVARTVVAECRLLKAMSSIVRDNLMTRPGYAPYCGNEVSCAYGMPRTRYLRGQFECLCGWRSGFDPEFIAQYEAKWTPLAAGDRTP